MAAQAGLAIVALANAWLNTLRNTSFAVAALYVQMHIGIPGSAGTANVCAGDTSRKAVTLAAASGGAVGISGTAGPWTHGGGGGGTETITHLSLWSAPTNGTFWWSVPLGTAKLWVTGEGLTLTTLGVLLAPLATD